MKYFLFIMIACLSLSCNLSWHASEEPSVKLRGCTVPVELKITEFETRVSLTILAFRDSNGYSLHENALKRDLVFMQDTSAKAVDSLQHVLTSAITYPAYEKDMGIKGFVIYDVIVKPDGILSEPVLKKFPVNSYGLHKEAKRALNCYLYYVRLNCPNKYYKLQFIFSFKAEEI